MAETLKIFLSIGRTYTASQREFRVELEALLSRNQCEQITLDSSSRTSLQPLEEAREKIRASNAIIVVAFERLYYEKVVEFRGADIEKIRTSQALPTPWNSIEAALGYGYGLPLLMILEDGLHQEAIVKDRHEYAAQTITITPEALRDPNFLGPFEDFLSRVRRKKMAKPLLEKEQPLDPDAITLRRLLDLPVSSWAAILSFVCALVVGAFLFGAYAEKHFNKGSVATTSDSQTR